MEQDRLTSMNISLPEPLKNFVEAEVSEGGYTSASEFVRELLRRAQKRRSQEERLDELLLEGLRSGDPVEVTEDFFEKKKQQIRDRLQGSE